ncbi:hypothetical protein [Nocardioides sp. NPDC047086]
METLDVRGLDDPTDPAFVAAQTRLRSLLAGGAGTEDGVAA